MSSNPQWTAIALAVASSFSTFSHAADEAVVVTATRQQQRANDLLADVSSISRDDIEQSGASSLAEILARQPGLQMASNGGAGKTSSIFIRGAEARHTLVLVDGLRVNSATLGTTALEDIPLSQIERVEILRGPASSLYGADAIGGVIQIFTRQGSGTPRLDAYAGYGSFNSKEVSAGYGGQIDAWQFSLRAGQSQTDGFSAVADRSKQPNYYQADADAYRNRNASASLAYKLSRDHELGAKLLVSSGENHYDGFKTSFDSHSDNRIASYSVYSRDRITAHWQSSLRFGRSSDELNDFGSATSRAIIRTDQDQWSWQNDLDLPLGRALLAVESLEQKVSGSTAYKVATRNIHSLLAGWTGNLAEHRFQLNVRRDDNSQFGVRSTGSAAYGYQFNEQWRGHASYGTAYNAPTFNQLYYPNYGVANLRPEFAHNQELGLDWESGRQSVSLVYFDNRITDLIDVTPSNVNRAEIKGWSLGYRAHNGSWRFSANLDLQTPRDAASGRHLARRADQQLNLALDKTWGALKLGLEIQSVGRRFDDVANSHLMGGYSLLNLNARYPVSRDWSLEVRGNNLTDRKYETAWGFGTAGANIFAGMRYSPQ